MNVPAFALSEHTSTAYNEVSDNGLSMVGLFPLTEMVL